MNPLDSKSPRHPLKSGMGEDHYRSIGGLVGLSLGFGLMASLGYAGIVSAAIFGAAGCVVGAIAAEKVFAWKQGKDR